VLITALIAPIMITGVAWFSISFGGIPQKLMSVAMSITFWMFVAFQISLSAMLIVLCFALPIIIWPVLFLIYVSVTISCILYDTSDGLKAGLDDALLKHSRAALTWYKQMGIKTEDIPNEEKK